MATLAQLVYNGKKQTVALYEGISKEELLDLLKTVFGTKGTIVGIVAEVNLTLNSPCLLLALLSMQFSIKFDIQVCCTNTLTA